MSFYPRLPDELKLKIWEEAIAPEHGVVHHFKIGVDRPREYHQTLLVQPQRNAKDDPSSWLDLWNLSVASRMSWDLVEKSAKGDRVLFWKKLSDKEKSRAAYGSDLPKVEDKPPKEVLGKPRGEPSAKWTKPTKAFIDADTDIVCFTLVGTDFDLGWLNWAHNLQRFRHLAHVAFNYFNPDIRPKDWISRPFECNCLRDCYLSHQPKICGQAMAQFLRVFLNLRSFYFLVPIVASRLARDVAGEGPAGGSKRTRGGQAVHKTGTELVTEAMDKFKVLARERGLSVFRDRKTTYYEVDGSGMQLLKYYEFDQDLMRKLTEAWQQGTQPLRSPVNWSHVQFKFLVYRGRPASDE